MARHILFCIRVHLFLFTTAEIHCLYGNISIWIHREATIGEVYTRPFRMIECCVTSIILALAAQSHLSKEIVDRPWRSLTISTYHNTMTNILSIVCGNKNKNLCVLGNHGIFGISLRAMRFMERYCKNFGEKHTGELWIFTAQAGELFNFVIIYPK